MSDTSGDDLFADFFVGMMTIIGAIMAVIIVFNVGYFITQRYVNLDAYVAVEYVASFFIGFWVLTSFIFVSIKVGEFINKVKPEE